MSVPGRGGGAKRALAVAASLAAAPGLGAEPVTQANWSRHPAILEIRAIYRETKAAEDGKRLRKLRRGFENCQPYEDTQRTLYLDARGAVRSYHFAGGSEDSAAERALYYDRGGRLRFALIKAGAANGTSVEYQIYLSEAGTRLWETRKLLEGPGYTFPTSLPEDELVNDPRQAFDSQNACPEAK